MRSTLKRSLLLLTAVAGLTSCDDGLCGNEVISEAASPGKLVKTVAFRRNCGATTPYSIHVSILATSKKLPDEGGNVFTMQGDKAIKLRWIDDDHLVITGDTRSDVFLKVMTFKGIDIQYENESEPK